MISLASLVVALAGCMPLLHLQQTMYNPCTGTKGASPKLEMCMRMQAAAATTDAQHQSHMMAELDRYAALQRAMAQAREAFDQEKEQLQQERQAALDAQARDFQQQLAVRPLPAGAAMWLYTALRNKLHSRSHA